MKRFNVAVLMSTYNGEQYLEEQINSIRNQKCIDVTLVIRDDGSSDGTLNIIRKYADILIEGNNVGYTYSFLELIKNAPDADFYALSDQDDIWPEDKLINAVDMISRLGVTNSSILYACARKNLIDGKVCKAKEVKKYKHFPFNGYNNGYHLQGCTMVFNKAFKDIINMFTPVDIKTSHDVWIHQLCKAINGTILYDERPLLIYRITNNNVIGVPKHRYFKRIKELFKRKPADQSYAISISTNLLKGYENLMSPRNVDICQRLSNYKKKKRKVLFCRTFYKGDLLHNIFLFLSFLFGGA